MNNLSIGDEVVVETSVHATSQICGKLVSIRPYKIRTDKFTVKALPDHVIKSIQKAEQRIR